jgi:hypothetical protein
MISDCITSIEQDAKCCRRLLQHTAVPTDNPFVEAGSTAVKLRLVKDPITQQPLRYEQVSSEGEEQDYDELDEVLDDVGEEPEEEAEQEHAHTL